MEYAEAMRKEAINQIIKGSIIPILGEGVYLIEEKYKGENVYVAYIPKLNFGYQITEPLYRFLCICIERKFSLNQIIEKIVEDFEVEKEVVQQDLAPWFLKFIKMGIIEYNETLPE